MKKGNNYVNELKMGISLVVQWLRLCPPLQEVWVQSWLGQPKITQEQLKAKQEMYIILLTFKLLLIGLKINVLFLNTKDIST